MWGRNELESTSPGRERERHIPWFNLGTTYIKKEKRRPSGEESRRTNETQEYVFCVLSQPARPRPILALSPLWSSFPLCFCGDIHLSGFTRLSIFCLVFTYREATVLCPPNHIIRLRTSCALNAKPPVQKSPAPRQETCSTALPRSV